MHLQPLAVHGAVIVAGTHRILEHPRIDELEGLQQVVRQPIPLPASVQLHGGGQLGRQQLVGLPGVPQLARHRRSAL